MSGVRRLFQKTGEVLVDLLKLDQPGRGRTELQQELISLRVGGGETVRNYYIRKMSLTLMAVTAGVLLAATSFFFYAREDRGIENQTLVRPGYGEGDRTETLAVEIDGEEVQECEITVQERKYTEEEKQRLTDHALRELERLLPGENTSLDEVRQDLVFPEYLEDGAVTLSWMTMPYGVIDESGKLLGSEDENGVLVEIQGTLTCGGKETVYTAYARVFPQELPEKEQLKRLIQKEAARADAEESQEAILKLPAAAGGRALFWLRTGKNPVFSILVLTLIAAVGIYAEMDSQVHRNVERRKSQLMLDYPDLLWKMAMLLGAGLSIKGTFLRLSEQYLKEKEGGRKDGDTGEDRNMRGNQTKAGKEIRYVYEEISFACYEMSSGIPEAEAYERFGRRCQLPEYIRLGAVLSQNLKKGAKGLTALLEMEAAASLTERKNHARKLSEKAGTKLLFPMMLMLGIVLVVLMVPAFLSF